MLMFWWDVRASGDTESTHTTYTVWVVLLGCSFYWIPNIRICKCPFLYGCSICVQILFGGGINVACTWATSILTDLFMYLKMRQKFKTKSNKINKIKKKIILIPFQRNAFIQSLCLWVFVLHLQSFQLCRGDTKQWHSLSAACVRNGSFPSLSFCIICRKNKDKEKFLCLSLTIIELSGKLKWFSTGQNTQQCTATLISFNYKYRFFTFNFPPLVHHSTVVDQSWREGPQRNPCCQRQLSQY